MKKSKFLVPILMLILISIFLIYNLHEVKKNANNSFTTTKVTTTKNLSSDKIFKDTIIMEGQKEEVSIKTYNSYFGYRFNYMIDYFKVETKANNTIYIYSLYDDSIYIKIENLDELKYYKEYNDKNDYTKKGYLYEHTYLKSEDTFLKVTKVLKNTSEYISGYGIRMDYVINSIEI